MHASKGVRNGMTIPVAVPTEAQAQQQLSGKLGGLQFYFSVMSYNAPMVVVIGVVPVMVARGTGIGTPISFVMAGIVLACFAVGFTMMSRILPRPGGFYSMITAGLGRSIGLGSGLLALLGYFCAYAGTFAFGGLAMDNLVDTTLNGPQLPWYGWGSVFWVVCAILGYVRVDVSANVLTVILILGLLTIAVYDVLVLIKGGAGGAGISLGPLGPAHWFDGSFSMGILLALGMYGGFEVAVLFREELDNPDRTIPRVTYGVIVLAMATYALSSFLFINSVGTPNVVAAARADPTAAMTRSLEASGGRILAETATVIAIISTFAVVLAAHNITARYMFNLSADKILPSRLSGVHHRHGSPHAASLVTSAAVLALGGVVVASHLTAVTFYTAMLGITSFVISVVIFIASLAVPIYLHQHARRDGVWRTKICPILAILGLGSGLVLAIVNFPALVGGSTTLALALMVLILGLFLLGATLARVYRRVRPEIYMNIGRR